MLDRCDEDGVGAYLESSKESNIAYYARFGFRVTEVVCATAGAADVARAAMRATGTASACEVARPALTSPPRMPAQIAFATCAELLVLDPDDELLAEAVRALGAEVEPQVWDDGDVDWARLRPRAGALAVGLPPAPRRLRPLGRSASPA